ncbi:MAG: hypothetical protein MMC23_006353 [Stictis urceolatum]|nr:hypothetical protein [Stictis urceolata]
MSSPPSGGSSDPAHTIARFELPGYTLPLNFTPRPENRHWRTGEVTPATGEGGELFHTALDTRSVEDGYASQRLTPLRELKMMQIMNQITDKTDWETKVFDDAVASKWKQEAVDFKGHDVTQQMMDWVVDELRWKAKDFKETRMLTVYDGDVVKSDDAVPSSFKLALQAAVETLENIPEANKDYHPGSDGKVLDLVHPSLFALVYGHSRILPDALVPLEDCKAFIGKGSVLEPRPEEETTQQNRQGWWRRTIKAYSQKFQWLPCDVELRQDASDDGQSWKITSYINNLDPQKHQDMYVLVEKLIAMAVPLWNKSLDPLKNRYNRPKLERIQYKTVKYDPGDKDFDEEWPEQGEDEDYADFEAREDAFQQRRREFKKLVIPEPGKFEEPDGRPGYDPMSLHEDFGRRGLQIIVKLANIHLTPEKPEYSGGTWHVEGQLNEHICATALYYYDVDNISDSYLSFRQLVSQDDASDVSYEQDDHDWLQEVFGCDNRESAMQKSGSVLCKEGRIVTFPNILQHRVEPFRLKDPAKPGHRKIVALFLVDPHIRVISTANIPPQQRDWWYELVSRDAQNPISHLPAELRKNVQDTMDNDAFPISLDKAKEYRLELMEERKAFVDAKEGEFQAQMFSLCEH